MNGAIINARLRPQMLRSRWRLVRAAMPKVHGKTANASVPNVVIKRFGVTMPANVLMIYQTSCWAKQHAKDRVIMVNG